MGGISDAKSLVTFPFPSPVPLIYLRLSSSNSGNRNRRIKKKGGAPMELVGVGKGVQR